jgi:hypothetical protein
VLQGLCFPTFRPGVLPSSSVGEVPKHNKGREVQEELLLSQISTQ